MLLNMLMIELITYYIIYHIANFIDLNILLIEWFQSYEYRYDSHKACSNSETGVHGTFSIPLRALETNSKTLLLNRLFLQ